MSSRTNVDCCADGHDGPALKLADALSRILAEVKPVAGGETLAVRNAFTITYPTSERLVGR